MTLPVNDHILADYSVIVRDLGRDGDESTNNTTRESIYGIIHRGRRGDGLRMNAYNHDDVDVAFDPLSANRRFPSTDDLAVLGTLIFAGPTRESIDVMVPDCLLPPVGGTVRVDLRHHVSLSLGPAVDMTNWVPETHLEKALCPSSLAKTLGLQRRDYWEELNPILEKWRSVNNTRCPECARQIRVNMARHLRLMHMTFVCFWR